MRVGSTSEAQPGVRGLMGWEALTPAESRVAGLVVTGLTNPEVAAELLIGAETVKTHLSRVFGKLGVANRKQLIAASVRRAALTGP